MTTQAFVFFSWKESNVEGGVIQNVHRLIFLCTLLAGILICMYIYTRSLSITIHKRKKRKKRKESLIHTCTIYLALLSALCGLRKG